MTATPTPKSEPRIVCAAIRDMYGNVLCSARHYDASMHAMIGFMSPEVADRFKHRHGDDQGFIDQHGQYYTRDKAWEIANANRQIRRHEACARNGFGEWELYSEALY